MQPKQATKATDGKPANPSKAGKPYRSGGKLQLDQLLTAILNLMIRHSPHELTFSRVARLTGVPRPTLYYYFGNSQKTMIEESIKFGMKAMTRLHAFDRKSPEPDWHSFQRKRLRDAVCLARRYPWAPALYFRYRNNPGEWGDLIRGIEDKYCEKLGQAWAGYHGELPDPRAIRLSSYLKLGFLWGLATEKEIWLSEATLASLEPVLEEFTRLVTDVTRLSLDPLGAGDPATGAGRA